MTEEEYTYEKQRLLSEIERNTRIKCFLVVKRLQRELDALEKEYRQYNPH